MLTRALGRSPDTYLITEHKKKQIYIPEETNPTPDRQFWIQAFGLPDLPIEEVAFDPEAFAHLNVLWNAGAQGKRLVIKNPNNIVRARELRRAFPEATFVWLLRNPWAVIQSMMGGNEAGHKNPMSLGAREILKHDDPVLRAAASWSYSVAVMNELLRPGDVTTRYEQLVVNPREEITRVTRLLSVHISDSASEVPERRKDDFRLARYLLRRSPARARIVETIAPFARELDYPISPPGFPGDDRVIAARYFLTWLKRPNRRPVYGYPIMQRVSRMVRGK
jgi:hypothetical protein